LQAKRSPEVALGEDNLIRASPGRNGTGLITHLDGRAIVAPWRLHARRVRARAVPCVGLKNRCVYH
jgi:hypothetical protein